MRTALSCRYFILVSLGLTCLLAGATGEAKETELKSEVTAAANINPNRRGTPQPVKLHILYLAQDEAFLQANFADLIDPESAILGDELIRRAETLVGPGDMVLLDEKFDEAAQFIGVVAEFTDIDEAAWRAVAVVPARKWSDVVKLFSQNKLQILIDGTSVSCAIVKD